MHHTYKKEIKMPFYQNPINDFYRAQYPQSMMQFPHQQPQIHCRFVTNIEEAKASMIDPLSMNIYLDSSNGKIYFEKLGNNGQSEFLSYTADENNQPKIDPLNEINIKLSAIETYLGELKNDKSVSVNESADVNSATVTNTNQSNAETESAGIPKNAGINKWKK